jgi:hypothetical protein
MQQVICVFLFVASISAAHAQLFSGTLVVVDLAYNQLILVADSRSRIDGLHPPDDTSCKIAAFDGHLVFASSGVSEFPADSKLKLVKSWRNVDEARNAIDSQRFNRGTTGYVWRIADTWAKAILSDWQFVYALYPKTVERNAEDGAVTTGMFAGVENGVIVIAREVLTFSKENAIRKAEPFKITRERCTIYPCAMETGRDIAYEFLDGKTPRAKREHLDASTTLSASDRLRRDVRLAELTKAYDPVYVNGDLDVVELSKGGGVHWVARKRNCPANQ